MVELLELTDANDLATSLLEEQLFLKEQCSSSSDLRLAWSISGL